MDQAQMFQRRSQLAWGVAVICVMFVLETWNADRLMPNPATPLVWALLGSVGAAAIGAALWYGRRARRAASAAPSSGAPDA